MQTFFIAAPASGRGHVYNNVLASYVHLHFASNPALAPALVQSCRRRNGP